MFQTFRAGEQLDGHQILGKIDNRPEFQRRSHSHGDVVLLSAGSAHIINASRMA